MARDQVSPEDRFGVRRAGMTPMSDLGHKQTCPATDGMSASLLKADIGGSTIRIWLRAFASTP